MNWELFILWFIATVKATVPSPTSEAVTLTTTLRATTVKATVPSPTSEAVTLTTTSKATSVKDSEASWTYIRNLNVYYLYKNELVTWNKAKRNCLEYGGDLASIRSEREVSVAKAHLLSTISGDILPEQGIWIGLNSLDDTGLWQWTDGSPVAYFHFESGYPANRDEHKCVVIHPNEYWRDDNCADLKAYLCTRRNDSVAEQRPSFSSEKRCPGKSWRRYWDNCFLVVEDAGTWSDAVLACSDHNSTLATISTREEQNMVFDNLPHDTYCFNIHDNDTECEVWAKYGMCSFNPVWMSTHCHKACNLCMHNCNDKYESSKKCKEWMQKGECHAMNSTWMIHNCAESCGICEGAPTRGFWLGLHTEGTGSYTWLSNDPVTSTNWDVKQPRSYGRERACTAMFLSTGTWNEGPCEQTLPGYVCKTPAEVPSTSTAIPPIECLYETPSECVLGMNGTYQEVVEQCSNLGGKIPTVQMYLILPTYLQNQIHWLKSPDFNSDTTECHTVAFSAGQISVLTNPCNMTLWTICHVSRQQVSTYVGSTVVTTTPTQSCSQNWHKLNNKCYRIIGFNEDRHSWHMAKQICDDIGASLISLHSEEEADFIQGLINEVSSGKHSIWLGLHASTNEEGIFTWSDGTSLGYQNWRRGEPNNIDGAEDCVVFIINNKKWNDQPCSYLKSFVCQAPVGKYVLPPPPPKVYENILKDEVREPSIEMLSKGKPRPECDDKYSDWFKYNDSCYLMVRTVHIWKDALENCRSMGGDLASIHSHEERYFLQGLLAKEEFLWTVPWIGYNDIEIKGRWTWSDGSSPDFIGWSPGEPNSKWFKEQCGALLGSALMNDVSCLREKTSLCKFYNGSIAIETTASDLPKGCPPDFYSFGNRCFYFGTTKLNFDSARDACFNRTSTIASIHSQQEQDFLIGHMFLSAAMLQQNASVWIGLKAPRYGYFPIDRWVDDTSYDFSLLSNRRSNILDFDEYEFENTECGYIKSAGEWDFATCTDENMYLCSRYQSSEFAGVTTTVDPYKQCPPGYGNIGYNCLRYIESAQSWNESQSLCQRDNASLASIANDIEFSQVRLALVNISQPVWFGGYINLITGFHWIRTGGDLKLNIPWEDNISDGYLYYNTNGKFNTANPASKRAAMCIIRNKSPHQATTIGPSTTTVSPIHDCRNGTLSFRGNCYLVVTKEKKTFANVIKTCSKYGMMVASIHSIQENQALRAYVKQQHQHIGELYIGLLQHPNMPAQWIDLSVVDYKSYLYKESESRKPCTVLSFPDGQWFHVSCKQRLGFICKGKPDVIHVTKKTGDSTSRTIPLLHGKMDTKQDIPENTADSSLSEGQVAGIVVGLVIMIPLVIVGMYILRGRMLRKDFSMMDRPSRGFVNPLFHKQEDAVHLDK